MNKDVKIVETAHGFAVKQCSRTYRPTRVLHELAAVLELVEAGYVSWRFIGNLEDPEVLDAATQVIQEVGTARKRLQRLLAPEESGARCPCRALSCLIALTGPDDYLD